MSRFLFVMMEGGGNVPPQLGVARRLRARGHEVLVLGDPALESEVHALGLELTTFQHAPHHSLRNRDNDRVRDYEAKGRTEALQRMVQGVSFGPAEAYARDTALAIERFAPDVAVVDCVLLGAAVAAEHAGVPTALMMHTIYFPTAPGAPPYGLGLRPARSLLARWAHAILGKLGTRWFDRAGLELINAVRASRSLPALEHVAQQYDRADRVLVMTAPGFDFASRAQLPSNVRYVGPGLDDPAWASGEEETADGHDSGPVPQGDAPLVVVGLGSTFQDQKSLTQRVLDAVAMLPVRGLITLGEVFEPGELSAPPHVRVVRAAPHAAIFPEASVVVAHGGHGTVMKALSCGVPLLCFGLGRDQADNAARVEESGAGLRLASDASVETIRSALARLLDEPVFRERATRLSNEIGELQRLDPVIRELESLATPALRSDEGGPRAPESPTTIPAARSGT